LNSSVSSIPDDHYGLNNFLSLVPTPTPTTREDRKRENRPDLHSSKPGMEDADPQQGLNY
jgi:hypothetical protein